MNPKMLTRSLVGTGIVATVCLAWVSLASWHISYAWYMNLIASATNEAGQISHAMFLNGFFSQMWLNLLNVVTFWYISGILSVAILGIIAEVCFVVLSSVWLKNIQAE